MPRKYLKVGKDVYSHKSILALVDENSRISRDPKAIIRHKAAEAISHAKHMGWNGPPFDPEILASYMGIKTQEAQRPLHSRDAEIRADEDGRLIIEYNPEMPRSRRHFSIAHEIAHTFFPDFRDRTHERHPGTRKHFDPEDQVEMLCDIGAAEMLMPDPEFVMDLQERGIGIDSLEELRMTYLSSRTATAIRMVQSNLHPCAVVLFDYSLKPSEIEKLEWDRAQTDLFPGLARTDPQPKLRVQFAILSESFPNYIPRHKSVDEDTPIYYVSYYRCIFRDYCLLDLGIKQRYFYIEAMPITLSDDQATSNPGVIAFLFRRQPERK